MKTLYEPSFEHDACGIGAVVNIDGSKSHKIVDNALSIVESIYVFKYETMCMMYILYLESVEPLSLYESMEGLDTGIVPWISLG